ncbi:hypothetical protein OHA62_08075 [Streptomyces sp. NBC_00343]|nr:sigma factor [Streptomyces sp. NBC_00343]
MSSRDLGEITRIEDAALTVAAQAGNVASLGLLLERHRAGMRAVAVSVLGPGPDVDDVMQDAALTALRRVGDVRDPEAVGPWLRMIVRNHARSLLRGGGGASISGRSMICMCPPRNPVLSGGWSGTPCGTGSGRPSRS